MLDWNTWNYLTLVTGKYDTLIYSPGYGGRRCYSLVIDDYGSKQELAEGPSLFNPLYLVQGDVSMGEIHSLWAMYVSAEKQTCDHDWYWEIKGQKANTW